MLVRLCVLLLMASCLSSCMSDADCSPPTTEIVEHYQVHIERSGKTSQTLFLATTSDKNEYIVDVEPRSGFIVVTRCGRRVELYVIPTDGQVMADRILTGIALIAFLIALLLVVCFITYDVSKE